PVRKDEQQSMARQAWCWRAHGAITQQVSDAAAQSCNAYKTLPGKTSGQLPFSGSIVFARRLEASQRRH
ncbi:MAG: hypothetical protein LC129_12440, partial [Burkholderiales bacterium]|nr:hypothetical protein [Burkholderiales bacterium]